MKNVLFVCVENAGRSQMAQAFGRAYGLDASSAGTVPAEKLNPMVVQVMNERGIALPGKPKMLTRRHDQRSRPSSDDGLLRPRSLP